MTTICDPIFSSYLWNSDNSSSIDSWLPFYSCITPADLSCWRWANHIFVWIYFRLVFLVLTIVRLFSIIWSLTFARYFNILDDRFKHNLNAISFFCWNLAVAHMVLGSIFKSFFLWYSPYRLPSGRRVIIGLGFASPTQQINFISN